MGKYSALKLTLEKAPVDSNWQTRINEVKKDYDGQSTAERGQQYCQLRDEKDRLEEKIKGINEKLEALSQLMIVEMEREGTNLFRLDTGDSLSIKDEPYSTVEDKTAFLGWIKSSGQEDLLSVHYMTLNAMSKERLLEGKQPPPGVKVFIKQSITRRKSKA